MEFEHFELEHHNDCEFDFLEVHEGGEASGPLVGRYCGRDTPPGYVSASNSLYLTFRSDYSVSRSGFRIRYKTGEREKDLNCVKSSFYLSLQRVAGSSAAPAV